MNQASQSNQMGANTVNAAAGWQPVKLEVASNKPTEIKKKTLGKAKEQ